MIIGMYVLHCTVLYCSVLYFIVRPVSVRTFNSRGYGHRRSFCLLFCSVAVTYVEGVPMERAYALMVSVCDLEQDGGTQYNNTQILKWMKEMTYVTLAILTM